MILPMTVLEKGYVLAAHELGERALRVHQAIGHGAQEGELQLLGELG
jgi:hypothetical protein